MRNEEDEIRMDNFLLIYSISSLEFLPSFLLLHYHHSGRQNDSEQVENSFPFFHHQQFSRITFHLLLLNGSEETRCSFFDLCLHLSPFRYSMKRSKFTFKKRRIRDEKTRWCVNYIHWMHFIIILLDLLSKWIALFTIILPSLLPFGVTFRSLSFSRIKCI